MQSKPIFNRLSTLISLLGLLTLLIGLVVMVTLPAIRIAAFAVLALGIILLAAAFIIDFRRVRKAVTGRRGIFSTGTTVMTSIFVGITILVNAISIGSYHRFDTTSLAQFTLTSQTKDVLIGMKMPVTVICFFVPNDPVGINTYINGLLKEYQNYTNKLTIKTIDPDANPDQAKKYGISMYQTVVFENDKGQRRLVPPNEIVQTTTDSQGNQQIAGIEAEHAFTSAILEVTGVVQKKIYFLTGHGESSINIDYSAAAKNLRDSLFKLDTLDLLITRAVPEDAAAVIIAGPQKALDATEIGIVEDYLLRGGWVMIMLNSNPTPDMKLLLYPWGINIADGVVVDTDSSASIGPTDVIIPRLRNFFGMTTIDFKDATAFIPGPDFQAQVIPSSSSDTPIQIVWMSNNSTVEMFSLARTSQESWLENNYVPGSRPAYDNVTEIHGPLDLAYLVVLTPPLDEKGNEIGTVPPTRLVLVGDSGFADNSNFNNGNNGDFFLNLVEVLTSGKELLSIERKVLPFRRLVVDAQIQNFIQFSSIGLLPLLVLLMGGIIWWRRR
jgi:ABC-type uncharacterized transport system involved in gliding motility auxiliary subunit